MASALLRGLFINWGRWGALCGYHLGALSSGLKLATCLKEASDTPTACLLSMPCISSDLLSWTTGTRTDSGVCPPEARLIHMVHTHTQKCIPKKTISQEFAPNQMEGDRRQQNRGTITSTQALTCCNLLLGRETVNHSPYDGRILFLQHLSGTRQPGSTAIHGVTVAFFWLLQGQSQVLQCSSLRSADKRRAGILHFCIITHCARAFQNLRLASHPGGLSLSPDATTAQVGHTSPLPLKNVEHWGHARSVSLPGREHLTPM